MAKNPVNSFLTNRFIKQAIENVKYLNIDSILDVGAGRGDLLQKFKENKLGKTLEGIEYSEKVIAETKKAYPRLIIKKGDIYDLNYRANSFDLVVSTQVLEHLDRPKKGLHELVRVSRKYVLLSVFDGPFSKLERNKLNRWNSKTFSTFVNIKGVKIVSKKRSFPFLLILLKKQ